MKVGLFFAAAALALGSAAHAQLTTFTFSGTQTSFDPLFPGTPVSGSFSYDASTAPTMTWDYDSNGTIDQAYFELKTPFTITNAYGTFTSNNPHLDVQFGVGNAKADEAFYQLFGSGTIPGQYLSLSFITPLTAYTGTLPVSFAGISASTQVAPESLGNPGYVTFDAPAAAVPEPGSWALMIGGIGLAGGALRRRRVQVAFA